jgi:CHASE2 domain-containing sensor protein
MFGGLMFGCALLLVGALRAVVAVASGRHIDFKDTVPGASLYLLGAMLGGSLAGVAWPLRRSRLGAALVGMLLIGGIAFTCMPLISEDDPFGPSAIFAVVVTTVILGGGIGLSSLYEPDDSTQQRSHSG